jgi:alkyl hydroperoxide reductase subunit AhpF
MTILDANEERIVRESLADLTDPVTILFFTQTLGCETCGPTKQILDAIAPLSDKLRVEEVNFVLDKEKVAEHGIDRVPAMVFVSGGRSRLRFYGVPAGYEFMSLIEAINLTSSGESGLSEESKTRLAAVTQAVHLQVFLTPT